MVSHSSQRLVLKGQGSMERKMREVQPAAEIVREVVAQAAEYRDRLAAMQV